MEPGHEKCLQNSFIDLLDRNEHLFDRNRNIGPITKFQRRTPTNLLFVCLDFWHIDLANIEEEKGEEVAAAGAEDCR